jgi:glutathione peroxidase-family protein
VDRAGNVVGRYAPSTTPAELAPEIDKLLAD